MQADESSKTPDQRATEVATSQAGCVARAQALEAGMSDSMIRNRVHRRHWRRLHPGVYVVGGAPQTWHQDVWAAALAAGPQVTVSHESALLLHGVPVDQLPRYPVTLTAPPGCHHRISGAVVHQLGDPEPRHIVDLAGLPVSRPDRAIIEVAANLKARRLGSLLDYLITERQTSLAQVATCLGEVAARGKRGVRTLGSVLDERGDGYVPPASWLEQRLLETLANAGLPPPVRQIELPGRGVVEGIVDAGYPEARLLIEADGRRWHSRQVDQRWDRLRDGEAARVGWLTLRFFYEQIVEEPNEVAATVDDVRTTRQAQLSRPAAA